MRLDDIQFEDEEQRRKYLADLAKLKRIREESKAGIYVDRSEKDFRDPFLEDFTEDTVPKKKKSHWFLWLILILLLSSIGYFGYHFFFHPVEKNGFYTVAVFGVDSRNGNLEKDALADVNILANVNMQTGEIRLVSIYRDTYARIREDNYYHKFNEAYFRGGHEQALYAVETNLDLKVDDYATFNWKAVVDTVNLLGGVDLEVSEAEYQWINGYITETVNSTGVGSVQLTGPGYQHLDGVQAVAYARLRKMDTDYQRTERQRKIIGLLLEKAKKADPSTLIQILECVLPQISTSVTIDDMIPFAKGIQKYSLSETCGFPFEKAETDVADRKDVVVPVTMESNVIRLHEFLWPEEEYTPSGTLKEISNHIAEITGLYGSE